MIVTFEKLQCWSDNSLFNVFLEKSAPVDLSKIAKNSPQYIQIGPYRVKIEIDTAGGGLANLRLGTRGVGIKNLAPGDSVSGSVFVFMPNEVETISTDGQAKVLGSASGCFEIHW